MSIDLVHVHALPIYQYAEEIPRSTMRFKSVAQQFLLGTYPSVLLASNLKKLSMISGRL